MKRLFLCGVAVVALAAPSGAGAFHHVFIPGGACGESANSGGSNPTAVAALIAAGQTVPIAPGPGSEAAEHEQAPSACPAPNK